MNDQAAPTKGTTTSAMPARGTDKLTLEDEAFEALKREHGEIIGVETCLGMVVFRSPREGEGERYKQMLYDDRLKSKAIDTLARSLVVFPSKVVFGQWLDYKPMLAHDCAQALHELMGLMGGAITKK